MAPGNMGKAFVIKFLVLLASLDTAWGQVRGDCQMDESYVADWYSMEIGRDIFTPVSLDKWGDLVCVKKWEHPIEGDFKKGRNTTMLMRNERGNDNCLICMDVLWRTENILQYKKKQTYETVNCISTWEGVYQFTYEVDWGGGGICDNPDNLLKACQDPGSPYVDNQVFMITYAKCPTVQTS